ncbi:DOMON-like domain-containing protein [Aurantiacibacter sp. D1-12]|uniref:DOMON-like domain-containing protein n=1 Tax=Aurantiacibacter sp. D1-12 TaxID=2993658 RepID=UPI00237D1D87|nr:DOMON-like domain-containing protein [Aurantiacibacter sp. D1-12]MDE1466703.1 DOMON-like domain-containing protein [Aurantiacibacter sp. D1-12]
MQTHELAYHAAHPPLAIRRVEARVLSLTDQWLRVRWRIDGPGKLVIPPFAGRGRADNLWQTTCFELFIMPKDGTPGYSEFNLSPSERWAAYDFTGYREGMSERDFAREPDCTMRTGQAMAIFDASLPRVQMPGPPCAIGLAAVLEEEGGVKSYWALSHTKDKPDFHDPSCFTAGLARTRAA